MAQQVKAMGVVGAGQMRAGIAQLAAAARLQVFLVDSNQAALARGLDAVASSLSRFVTKGSISQIHTGTHVIFTNSLRLGFTAAFGSLSELSYKQGRSKNFVAVSMCGNQIQNTFPVHGVRCYRGGGRGRGRTVHDFDNFQKDYAPVGEDREFGGRDRFAFDRNRRNRDDSFQGDYKKFSFREEDDDEVVEKPETAKERLQYLRNREREMLLQKFSTVVIDVNRTFKVTKGGGEISFTALVISGNENGLAGWGKGKGPKATRAITEASVKSLRNLYYFERFKDETIYHYVEAKYEKTKVRLWPEWTLGKFRAGGVVSNILKLAGIKTVKSKLIGSKNPFNTVRATFLALSKIQTPKEYEEKYWRAVVERHLILDADGNPHPKYRKVSSYVL